ncbi:MAG TPA: aminotransferase class V-fold PLP-dependent enzyme [Ignavibacteriales bacterium]|nr:aminotransferase class V-fold PLP-dependent enzyme [Ignavibacteriales bacterium]
MHIPVNKLLDNFYSIFSRRVYLDNNATTQLDDKVRMYMYKIQKTMYGNPSSMHMPGMRSREVIENARLEVSRLINATPEEIIFTSGGTESNNTIIKAVAAQNSGAHFITSSVEHQSVLTVFKSLEEKGFEVSYIGVDNTGKVNIQQIKNAIRENTRLISVMHVNNETGSVNDIGEIARLANLNNILFHSDVVQSYGKLKVDVRLLHVDYLSISSHKIYGPKGCGAMYVRKDAPFMPLLEGGHQESVKRAGTEALYNIAGFGMACRRMLQMDTDSYLRKMALIRSIIFEGVQKIFPDVRLNGDINGFPSTLNLMFPGIPNSELISYLDYYNVAVSAGSACVAGSEELSHVLLSLGLRDEEAASSIRISIGKYNSLKDAEKFLKVLTRFKYAKEEFFEYAFPERIGENEFSDKGKLFADLRSEKEMLEHKSLPGSIPVKPQLKELKKLPRDKEIILICEDGYISNYFAPKLKNAGWKNVKVMFGGHKRWRLINKIYHN